MRIPNQVPHQEERVPSNIHELSNQARCIRFKVPSGYACERMTGTLLALSCSYPFMLPISGDDGDRESAVMIFITLSDGPSRADRLVSTATLERSNDRTCQHYYAGQQGPISIYRRSDMADACFNVFRARDGALVCVEDAGDWSTTYSVYRKLGKSLCVHYEIPKSVGRGFMQFDSLVTKFLHELKLDPD